MMTIVAVLEDLTDLDMFAEDGKESDDGKIEGDMRLDEIVRARFSKVIPVSSSTGAGISTLWSDLLLCARNTSAPLGGSVNSDLDERCVREHIMARVARKTVFISSVSNKGRRTASTANRKD